MTNARQTPLALAPATLRAVMRHMRRDGYWTIPQRLEVRAVMSEVKLDLRLATVPYGCVIALRVVLSSVIITLPPGLAITLEVDEVLSRVENKASSTIRPEGLGTSVRVEGELKMSSLVARIRSLR